MNGLLKGDFFRLKKDKMVLIGLIVVCGLSLMTVMLYLGITLLMKDEALDLFGVLNGKSLFLSSLSFSNNTGLILPIFIVVLIAKEFNYGTIRNKIITGKSREKIFASAVISTLTVGLVLYSIGVLINLLLGSLLLGYGSTFNFAELWYIVRTMLISLIMYSAVLIITILIIFWTKNMGVSIALSIALVFVSSIFGSISVMLVNVPDYITTIFSFFTIYQNTQISSMVNVLANETVSNCIDPNSVTFIIRCLYTSVIYFVGFYLLGLLAFKKGDIK